MVVELLTLLLAPNAQISATNAKSTAARPAAVAFATDKMIPPQPADVQIEELAVRISSPAGVLWQGNVRVAQNQGASYSQSFSQASPTVCPTNSPYDRSERSSINFNVYVQNNGEYGMIYRVDASWQRPTDEPGCGDRGTRTVQVTKALSLDPGESGVVEGDAGLRLEVTRRR